MTTLAETSTVDTTPRHGFDSLDEETRVQGLPVTGELPRWLQGKRPKWSYRPRTDEVRQ